VPEVSEIRHFVTELFKKQKGYIFWDTV